MASLPNSPAFTPQTPSTEPGDIISTVGQMKHTEWGARVSAQPSNVKSQFTVKHLKNGE